MYDALPPPRRGHRLWLALALVAGLGACGGNFTQSVSKDTGKTRYLDPNYAKYKFQGLSAASITPRGVMTVSLSERLYAPEHEAPVVTSRYVTGERANPVGTTFLTVFTVGIYPLLDPKHFFKHTFGHETSSQVLSEEPDRTRAKPTGRLDWVTLPMKQATLTIRTPQGNLQREVRLDDQGNADIDLSDELFRQMKPANDKLAIVVECTSCTRSSGAPGSTTTPGPVSSISVPFAIPAGWPLVAEYSQGRDLAWVADSGLVGDKPGPSAATARPVRWRDIAAAAQRRGESKLLRLNELPEALKRERQQIEASQPPPEVTLVRDEFESTAAFRERVRTTQNAHAAKVAEYNRRVDELNRKIREFQQSVPRALPRPAVLQTLQEAMVDLLGEPSVKKVVYDADLQRFIVTVAGARQDSNAPVSFTLVTQSEINADAARRLKPVLHQARPFLRLAMNEKAIRPLAGHLLVGDQTLAMDFVDNAELPALDTVRLEAGQLASFRPVKRLEGSGNVQPSLVLSEDDESRRLRERLEQLRDQIRQREQVSNDKEQIQNDIRQLESRLRQLAQGTFDDDLEGLIKRARPGTASGNTYAVVIGIAHYDSLPAVTFADRSAASFADAIGKLYGVPRDRMMLLLNDEATGLRMMARIRQMTARLGPNDRLIVYYAGHAAPSRDGKNIVLVPNDATDGSLEDPGFMLSTLYQTLLRSQAPQILVVLDTCFSGRTDDKGLLFRDIAPVLSVARGGLTPPNEVRLTVLTAGGPNDFANALRPRGHRLFSYHLMHELLRSGGLRPDRFKTVADAVARDALALGPDYRQQPLWLGKRDTMAP